VIGETLPMVGAGVLQAMRVVLQRSPNFVRGALPLLLPTQPRLRGIWGRRTLS
jgi:hypothetical protein